MSLVLTTDNLFLVSSAIIGNRFSPSQKLFQSKDIVETVEVNTVERMGNSAVYLNAGQLHHALEEQAVASVVFIDSEVVVIAGAHKA
jgi:hypothetical protein